MQLNVRTNFPKIFAELKKLDENLRNKVLVAALNKTVVQGSTAASREIREEYNIKASTLSRYLSVERASIKAGRYVASLVAETSRSGQRGLRLSLFSPTKRTGGVSVKVRRAGKRSVIKGAFIADMPNGVTDVVSRSTSSRSPLPNVVPKKGRYAGRVVKRGPNKGQRLKRQSLRVLYTLEISRMFNKKTVKERIKSVMLAKFPENYKAQANFYLSKFNQPG
jgi:Prophage minor tail protein Z (GPZ)